MRSEWAKRREAEASKGRRASSSPCHITLEALTSVPAEYPCQPTQKSQMTSSTERVESRRRKQHEGAEGGIKEGVPC